MCYLPLYCHSTHGVSYHTWRPTFNTSLAFYSYVTTGCTNVTVPNFSFIFMDWHLIDSLIPCFYIIHKALPFRLVVNFVVIDARWRRSSSPEITFFANSTVLWCRSTYVGPRSKVWLSHYTHLKQLTIPKPQSRSQFEPHGQSSTHRLMGSEDRDIQPTLTYWEPPYDFEHLINVAFDTVNYEVRVERDRWKMKNSLLNLFK